MYTSELRPEISQGDVFREVEFALLNGNGEPVKVKATVLLLSHDCDFDKPNNPSCLVAMINPLASVPADHQANIRNYRVISTFYRPESPSALGDSYVDLRLQATLHKTFRLRADRKGQRIASLTNEAREALQDQIFLFFAREDVPS